MDKIDAITKRLLEDKKIKLDESYEAKRIERLILDYLKGRKNWWTLGSLISYIITDARPNRKKFEFAANLLKIKVSDAQRAWSYYASGTEGEGEPKGKLPYIDPKIVMLTYDSNKPYSAKDL